MFSLDEVIIITAIVSAIVGYLCFQWAEIRLVTKMISTLTDEELKKLEKLEQELDEAISDEEAAKIINRELADSKNSKARTLTQEVVDGQTFLYENNSFIAQGSSAVEAAANFFKSTNSVQATVVCSEGKSYKIINGKIER